MASIINFTRVLQIRRYNGIREIASDGLDWIGLDHCICSTVDVWILYVCV